MNCVKKLKLSGLIGSVLFLLTVVYLPRMMAANSLPSFAVQPNFGPTFGNITVVIRGRDFRPGARVRFGANEGQVIELTSTSITVDVPPGEAGNTDLEVSNTDGSRGRLRGGFVYRHGLQAGGASLLTAKANDGALTATVDGGMNLVETAGKLSGRLTITKVSVSFLGNVLGAPAGTDITGTVTGNTLLLDPIEVDVSITGVGQTRVIIDRFTGEGVDSDQDQVIDAVDGAIRVSVSGLSTVSGNFQLRLDRTPPSFLEIQPANRSTMIYRGTRVRVTLAEPVHPDSVNPESLAVMAPSGELVPGTFSVRENEASFLPGAPLEPGTVYTVKLTTPVADLAGNVLAAEMISSFTTGDLIGGPPPVLHSIGPTEVSNATNYPVTLYGAGFEAGAELVFSDGTTLPTTLMNPTRLAAVIPQGLIRVPEGSPDIELGVRVRNPDGQFSEHMVTIHVVDDLNFDQPHSAVVTPDGDWVYITNPTRDEVLVFNTQAKRFEAPIKVGDHPYDLKLTSGGSTGGLVLVTNRHDSVLSVISTSSRSVIANIPTMKFAQDVIINRNASRTYVSNQHLDGVLVYDIRNPFNPSLITTVPVGRNPRTLVFNRDQSKLYVANFLSGDVSVIETATDRVIRTLAPQRGDRIVGGTSEGFSDYIVGGHAPRGLGFSAAQNLLFISSIGPNIGPNPQGLVGGGRNPTITVVDAENDRILHHVGLDGADPDQIAVDDLHDRLYVTCNASGTLDVLDTVKLKSNPGQAKVQSLPLPLPPNTPLIRDEDPRNLPGASSGDYNVSGRRGPEVQNEPRAIAVQPDGSRVFVVNEQMVTLSIIDAGNPGSLRVIDTIPIADPFKQMDRRLGTMTFFSDLGNRKLGCGSCHLEDHVDGVFFETDTSTAPKLRRVLSVRNTRRTIPLLQEGSIPDMESFFRIVISAERNNNPPASPAESRRGQIYGDNITLLPNPNLNPDGTLSVTVALPGGGTGNAGNGETLFLSERTGCVTCHMPPLFTEDQDPQTRGRTVNVGTPERNPIEDANSPAGAFAVPSLRGLWDSFPYLSSGSARSLREVLTTYNRNDRHGVTSILSEQELKDLEAFLLSL
ncbi:MAG: Ig-like domain-containing protein [Acidobacteria bacterium]|nr:Ig-like domain-containing protein [Acidobacteriota bacterium]